MLIAMAVHDTVENNRSWMTRETLRSLARTVDWYRHHLIIIDNDSCQETLDIYSSIEHDFGLTWRLIPLSENLGTANAINRAWKHREPGEHCVKMDNDVVIHQTLWVDMMEDVFKRDPEIGICGLKRKDLEECPWGEGDLRSVIRMLPHEKGQEWLIVEEIKGGMGTCQAYSSLLLDKIGYLVQPGVYGFDDSLSAIRAGLAGFKRVYLHGVEIDHIDPGGDAYCQWKIDQAAKYWEDYKKLVMSYRMGVTPLYHDGGFDA